MSCRGLGLKPFLLYLITGTLYCRNRSHGSLRMCCVWSNAVPSVLSTEFKAVLPWCAHYEWSGAPSCLFPVHLKTQHNLLSLKLGLFSKPLLFNTHWFWCPWKAERHSVGSSPSCPWRWSRQWTWAETIHTYKMLILKQSDNDFSECTICS